MKALTTILMLCLPVAAMGEIYVCSSESYSILSKSTYSVLTNEVDLTDYVVNMESGFRELTDDSSYIGECLIPEGSTAIVCSYENRFSAMQFYIHRSELTFSYSQHLYGESVRSYFGKCTEI